MTKKLLSIVVGLAGLALVVATPVMAGMMSVSDSDLSSISGKNAITFTTSCACSSIAQDQSGDQSANISVAVEQWFDNHSADASDHKGANDLSGATTQAQQTVTAEVNAIQWGSAGNTTFDATTLTVTSGGYTNMAYGVFAGGGF
jgi:hypothetical protein